MQTILVNAWSPVLEILPQGFARFSENRTWILSSQCCANDATSFHLYMYQNGILAKWPKWCSPKQLPKKMNDQFFTITWRLDWVPSVDHQGWTGKSRYGLWATPKCQERTAGGGEGPHLKECSALTKTRRPYDCTEYSYQLLDRIGDAMVDWYPNH